MACTGPPVCPGRPPDRHQIEVWGNTNYPHLAAPDRESALLPAPHAARLDPFFLQIETLRNDLLSYW